MAAVNADIPDQIVHVAKSTAKRFTGFVTQEDVVQELHLYVLSNERQFQKWYADDEKFRIIRALFAAARQYAEREKAAQSGYDFTDVAWYDPVNLASLVPLALNPRWEGLSGDSDDSGMPQGKAVLGESGTLLAMVCDIRRALKKSKFTATDFDPATDAGSANLDWLCGRLGGSYPYAEGYHPRRKAVSNAKAIAETQQAG